MGDSIILVDALVLLLVLQAPQLRPITKTGYHSTQGTLYSDVPRAPTTLILQSTHYLPAQPPGENPKQEIQQQIQQL